MEAARVPAEGVKQASRIFLRRAATGIQLSNVQIRVWATREAQP